MNIMLIGMSVFLVFGCGFPGAPAHSTVKFSDKVITKNTVAIYSCDRGFELLGPSRRICQSNGTWTPQGIPFCGKYHKKILKNLRT